MACWGRDVEIDTLVTVAIAPWAKLPSLFGVERQSVDVVWRCAASHAHNMVSRQVDRLLLDLVQQDGVHPAVQDGRLGVVVHGECPDEALVNKVDAFWEAGKVGVNEERSLLCVAKRSGAGTGVSGWLGPGLGDRVNLASPKARGRLDLGPPVWHLLLFPVVPVGSSSSPSAAARLGISAAILFLPERRFREVSEDSKARLVLLIPPTPTAGLATVRFGVLRQLEEPLVLRDKLVVIVVVVLQCVIGIVLLVVLAGRGGCGEDGWPRGLLRGRPGRRLAWGGRPLAGRDLRLGAWGGGRHLLRLGDRGSEQGCRGGRVEESCECISVLLLATAIIHRFGLFRLL